MAQEVTRETRNACSVDVLKRHVDNYPPFVLEIKKEIVCRSSRNRS